MPTCPWCAAPLRPAAAYCTRCGQRLTPGTLPPLTKGTLLQAGRYRLQQRLGVGGAGDVYLAHDTRLFNRAVVVKRLLVRTSDPRARVAAEHNFAQEACALVGLNHDRIPRILDFFTDPPHLYLVMEYAPGDTLAAIRDQQGGQLPAPVVAAVGAQVAALLAYLHGQQPPIAHRDIKPANLILGPDGAVVLVDFGLARPRPDAPGTEGSAAWGTAGYAPPEQLAGHAGTPADVYALGATLRELLTGAAPGEPIRGFARPPPATPTATLLERLIPLITAMMDPDPAGRPSAALLAGPLGALAVEFPPSPACRPPLVAEALPFADQPTRRMGAHAPAAAEGAASGACASRPRKAARGVDGRASVAIGGGLGLVVVLGISRLGPLLACHVGSALVPVMTTVGWPLALIGIGLGLLVLMRQATPPTLPRLITTLILGAGSGVGLPILLIVLLQILGVVQRGCP